MAIFGGNRTIQMAFEACSEENSALLSYQLPSYLKVKIDSTDANV